MSCADVQTIQSGNGSKTQFSFDFPYIFKSEIHVYFWNRETKEYDEIAQDGTGWAAAPANTIYPWRIDDANPTIVEFTEVNSGGNTAAVPPAPAAVEDPNETLVPNVKIRRITNTDDIRALFNPGSAIRSDDLNKNFEQLRYALQEANCPGVPEDVEEYLKDYYWDKFDRTVYGADTWASEDDKVATTAAIDNRVDTKIDTAITTDITGADGIDVRPNTSNGTTVIGIQEGGIDADRLLEDDIIIETEGLTDQQNSAFTDDKLVSAATAEHRYRNYVQVDDPGINDKLKGQIWLENDANKTLSVYDGNSWVGVASGGTFTTQPTTIYVDRYSGNDENNGRRIINQVRTIKRALELANNGDLISIAPGVYQEQLPLDITQKNLSIVGDSIRSVFVQPLANCESKMQDPLQTMEGSQTTDTDDAPNPDYWNPENTNQQNYVDAVMFRCNSGTYISNITFVGMKADTTGADPHPIDAYNASTNPTGLPSYQGWIFGFLPGAKITKSPYIQNCTNFTDSQIVNSNYRQDYSDPMPGDWDQVEAYNTSTVAAGTAGDETSAPTGGGIIIDGAKTAFTSKLRSIVADSFTQVGLKGPGIFVTNNGYTQLTSSYSFFGHYHLKAHNGGQANLAASTTDFGDYALIADGKSPSAVFTGTISGSYGTGATQIRVVSLTDFNLGGGGTGVPSTNMVVKIGSNVYPILAWDGTFLTIFEPDQTNASLNAGLVSAINGGTAEFYFRSMVASSGHTMEYAGSGTDYTALPENGGTPDDTKQLTELDDGKIWAVIVDHQGKFKAGDFEVDQQSGSVSLPAGSLGIPLLIQNLDTDNKQITSTHQDGIQITAEVDLNSNQIVGLGDIDAANDTDDVAANKGYVDTTTVSLAGDTMTGDLAMGTNKVTGLGTPTANADAATKEYVDTEVGANTTAISNNATDISNNASAIADRLPLAGGTMTGPINLDSNNITNGGSIAATSVTTTGNIVIGGNLQVDGTTTTVNSTEITLDDKNLTLSSIVGEDFVGNTTLNSPTISGLSDDDYDNVIANMLITGTGVPADTYIVSKQTVNNVKEVTVSNNITAANSNVTFSQTGPSDAYSDGGGVTVKGTTDKTFNYVDSSASWTSSENINVVSGKDFKIAGTSVLTGTTLGSTVTDSSLTSVGTIGTGTWNGTAIGVAYGGSGLTATPANGQLLIGNSTGFTLSTLTAGSNVQITESAGGIEISATDTDTTYSAGDGIALSQGNAFSVDLATTTPGLEISSAKLQVDSTVVRTTGATVTGDLILSEDSNNILNTLAFKELAANGSHFVGFKAPAGPLAGDVTWTLPDADGTANQTLSTDGSGTLYWQTPTTSPLKGAGGDQVFFENDKTITTAYTITQGKNAMSAGPISVAQGATPNIPSGSTWTIV